jgi:hypothetical protein
MSPHGHENLTNCAVQTDYKAMPITGIGIGFGGRGDAKDIESFYKLILEAREAWSPVPKPKWIHEGFYHPDPNRNGTASVLLNEVECQRRLFLPERSLQIRSMLPFQLDKR